MKSMKEAASTIAASAKAGLENTKATVQEKAENFTTSHPAKKEEAAERKDERIRGAEREKKEMRDQVTHGGAVGDGGIEKSATWPGTAETDTDNPLTSGFPAEAPVTSDYATGVTKGTGEALYTAGTYTGSGRTPVRSDHPSLTPPNEGTTRDAVGQKGEPGEGNRTNSRETRERSDGSDRDLEVGVQDVNVAGGVRTGYGAGSTL